MSEHASSELAQSYLRSLEIAGDSTVSPARDIKQVWIPEYVELGHPARQAPHTLGSPRIRPHAPQHTLPHMLPHTLHFTHPSASASARLPISPRIRRALHASVSSGCTPTAAYAAEYSTACATESASVCAKVVRGCAREGTASSSRAGSAAAAAAVCRLSEECRASAKSQCGYINKACRRRTSICQHASACACFKRG